MQYHTILDDIIMAHNCIFWYRQYGGSHYRDKMVTSDTQLFITYSTAVTEAEYIDGLAPDCSMSSVLAMEIMWSCTKPSISKQTLNSQNMSHCCPACRTSLIATKFWVVVICPIIKCLTVLVFFYFVWFVFIHHNFQFHFELCTYCNILDIYLS